MITRWRAPRTKCCCVWPDVTKLVQKIIIKDYVVLENLVVVDNTLLLNLKMVLYLYGRGSPLPFLEEPVL